MTITIAQDTCIRANQSGLGTASDGETWAIVGTGTGSIVSNRGQITNTSGTGANRLLLGGGTMMNGDIYERMSISSTTDTIGFIVRRVDTNNYVQVAVANGSITVRVIVSNVGTNLTPTTGITLAANTNYQLHINLNNNVYSVNVWLDGTSEPAGWVCQATDSVGTATRRGQYGPYAFIGTINDIILFDNFLVTSIPPTIYIAPTGNDSTGDGSLSNPYLTLGKADTMVPSGGTVSALPGTYTSSSTFTLNAHGTPLAHITYQSAVQWAALLRTATVQKCLLSNGNCVDIVGFDVSTDSAGDVGIWTTGSYARIRQNYIHDIPCPDGATLGGAGIDIHWTLGSETGSEVSGNLIVNIGAASADTTHSHGIYFQIGQGSIFNNLCINIKGGFGVKMAYFATNVSCCNNALLSCAGGGILIVGGTTGTSGANPGITLDYMVVNNNIIRDCYADFSEAIHESSLVPITTGIHNQYVDNLIYGGSSTGFSLNNGLLDVGTLRVDPKMVNYQIDGSGDYHLLSTSPCIDAGTSIGAPSSDFDGVTRPQGAGYDIGPYEALGAYWSWDTANSRVAASANQNALALANSVNAVNVRVQAVTNQSYLGGLVVRYRNKANYYSLIVCDSLGQYPNTMRLSVMAGGTETLLASQPITFTRGTYHILLFTIIGTTLLGYFDGKQIISMIDSTLSGSGLTGLYHGGGASGTTNWYDFGTRALGSDATGKRVYTRIRMTSTDPLVTPRLTDLVASVRSPDLATGSVIPQTQHAYKDSVAAFLDDIAKQSNLSWRFDESYQLKMTDRLGQFAPFVIATVNGNIDGVTAPTVSRFSPLYRNRQYITGAIDLATIVNEPKMGDGVTQSWGLAYPVETMQTIMLNGEAQSFGIQGTDTGRAFYYQQGSNTLTIDSSLTPPASTFTITYTGQVPYRAMAEDTGQQAVIAALDHSTGIVEMSEDAPGLLRAAADALAASRITQYARLALDWKFVTRQSGLGPGQLLTVVVPQHALNDLQFLITEVSAAVSADKDGNLLYWYTVSTTTGPSLGNWSRKLQTALLTKG